MNIPLRLPSLKGYLLIATSVIEDPCFIRSVVFLCAHSSTGAMGIVVNRPAPDMTLRRLMREFHLNPKRDALLTGERIYAGGPAEPQRGFVLHSGDYVDDEHTLIVDPTFSMTATPDILRDIAQGSGPARRLVAMGYAGWGAGQLERELRENAWLTVEADPKLVFKTSDPRKWVDAVQSIGIDPSALSGLSGQPGHA